MKCSLLFDRPAPVLAEFGRFSGGQGFLSPPTLGGMGGNPPQDFAEIHFPPKILGGISPPRCSRDLHFQILGIAEMVVRTAILPCL